MNRIFRIVVPSCLLLAEAVSTTAATLYVDLNNPTPAAPYLSWTDAATNIQDAVDAAAAGDQVIVTNGVYQTGGRVASGHSLINRVVVDKAVAILSANGPAVTMIQGNPAPHFVTDSNAVRCAYLAGGALLAGFTLTNGATLPFNGAVPYLFQLSDMTGGGVWCESQSAILSNCVLTANSASGNFAIGGGGAYSGTLYNCTLTSNTVTYAPGGFGAAGGGGGGGACQSTLNNCLLVGNSAALGGGGYSNVFNNCTLTGNFGGVGGAGRSLLNNCVLSNNTAIEAGGGCYFSILNNCRLTGNTADIAGGGDVGSKLSNCVLSNNSAPGGGGAWLATLVNCTLTGNSAMTNGGGAGQCSLTNCTIFGNSASVAGGGVDGGKLYNCIVFNNSAVSNANANTNAVLNYCCTVPLPGSGAGNFTNAPLFMDETNGDFRLRFDSPCINAGRNDYIFTATDLDGNLRIVGGTVDVGAYECQSPASAISFAWLQQYGLALDGSADFQDSDQDGMSNWQEWIAGTNPMDAASALRVLSATNAPAGVAVSWQSVTNRTYSMERSGNLSAAPAFALLQSGIQGLNGSTTFMDTNAAGAGPFFYRVKVEQ